MNARLAETIVCTLIFFGTGGISRSCVFIPLCYLLLIRDVTYVTALRTSESWLRTL